MSCSIHVQYFRLFRCALRCLFIPCQPHTHEISVTVRLNLLDDQACIGIKHLLTALHVHLWPAPAAGLMLLLLLLLLPSQAPK